MMTEDKLQELRKEVVELLAMKQEVDFWYNKKHSIFLEAKKLLEQQTMFNKVNDLDAFDAFRDQLVAHGVEDMLVEDEYKYFKKYQEANCDESMFEKITREEI